MGATAKLNKPIGRAVTERVTEVFRQNLDDDTKNWIDAGSAGETPTTPYSLGAAEWVTTAPKSAALTLRDDEFLLAVRARVLLPIAPTGSECAYRPSSHRVACSEWLDVMVRHSHCCARSFVLSRHHDLIEAICEFARKAGLQAMTEHFAAQTPYTPHMTSPDRGPADHPPHNPRV